MTEFDLGGELGFWWLLFCLGVEGRS